VFAILEHEAMHQETMIYMLHQLPYEQKLAPRAEPAHDAGTMKWTPFSGPVRSLRFEAAPV
jgi:hypothetical protein